MALFEVLVMRGDEVVHRQPVGSRPVNIGRAPINDLVLTDDQISWHHAVLWAEGGRLWVKDLGSTNGTFVGDARVTSPRAVEGALRLGPAVHLKIAPHAVDRAAAATALALEDLTGGLRFSLDGDRFYIGAGDDAHLRLPDGPARAGTLLIHEGGEVWLGTDDDESLLEVGQPFEVGGRRLILHEVDALRVPTREARRERYPYHLRVTLQGSTGPEAALADVEAGRRYTVRSDNRAVLLYLLARRVRDDRAAGLPPDEAGWCADSEVAAGIWGRNWQEQAGNHLHVLIHRLRKQLKSQGFDPWFIEKRRRRVRARVQAAEVV